MGGFKRENYIHIEGWMITDLNLKGNELLVYAIIYGFTQDGETWFKGSSKYISDALQVARNTAIKAINSLLEKGLIIKTQENINDVIFNRYKVSDNPMQNLTGGRSEIALGGRSEIDHSNNNKELYVSNNKGTKKPVYFPLDEKLNSAFSDYVEMRKKIKAPMTERAVTLAIKKLEELSNHDNDIAIEIVNQSIMNSWKGLFPLKEQKKVSGGIDWSKI